MPAFEGHEQSDHDPSFSDILHRIRVLLAGRAAEDLVLGAQQTSAPGACSDLQKATEFAASMIKDWGYGGESTHKNLAVFTNEVSPVELASAEEKVRTLLGEQYLEVLAIFNKHKTYLMQIIYVLCEKKVIFTEDFYTISGESNYKYNTGRRPSSSKEKSNEIYQGDFYVQNYI